MRRALLPIAGLLATAALAVLWSPSPPAPVLDEPALPQVALPLETAPGSIDELRARIGDVLAREHVPGAGIALVGRDGLIWAGGVGVADLASKRPVDGDTVFRVASITKVVVGLGVMRLAEQGRLALDRPLRELMPDVAIDNAWEATAPVTLAQTLEHTAGLDDMHPNETFVDDDAMTPAAALALNPRSRVIRWPPGTRMAYSNVGYGLAGRAIELATGEPFDAWLRREVLLPLGMRDADFRRTPTLAGRLATGYRAPGVVAEFRPIAHRPAGSLLASPRDLAAVVQLFLRRGPAIVSRAGLARIERAGSLPYLHTDVEYGLGNGGDVGHPMKARGHDGGLPGFVSALRYIPELGAGYVMLLNSTSSFRAYADIRRLLFAYLARGTKIAAPPGSTAAPSTAFYRYANPRHALFAFIDRSLLGWNVTADGSGAHVDQLVGPPFELLATKDGGYRFPFESGTSTRLARAPDGTPVLLLGGFIYAEQAAYWPARLRVLALELAFCLLMLAPFYALGARALAALRGQRLVAPELTRWPAIAGLCLIALPRLFLAAAERQLLGEVHPWTVAICATTIVFGVAALASAVVAVRWSVHPERPSRWRRLVPTATAIAALGLALWLGANGLIGHRTWAW